MDNNVTDTLDLDAIITSEDDSDLVFVGDKGDIIDFKESEDWTASTETTKVDGQDGNFTEYTNSDVSVFINEDIAVIGSDF